MSMNSIPLDKFLIFTNHSNQKPLEKYLKISKYLKKLMYTTLIGITLSFEKNYSTRTDGLYIIIH